MFSIKRHLYRQVRCQSSKATISNKPRPVETAKKLKPTGSGHSVNAAETPKSHTTTIKIQNDYSWLPKAPETHHLRARELTLDAFYAGYRPVYVQPKKTDANLYDLAMALDTMEPLPWVASATGTEYFPEWDDVPSKVVRDLRPFEPPQEESREEKEQKILLETKRREYEKEKQRLQSSKGRKKTPLKLLKLKREMFSDEE